MPSSTTRPPLATRVPATARTVPGAPWRAWCDEGQTLTLAAPNGAEYPHPLLKIIREAERDAQRYGEALGIKARPQGRPGRHPEAVGSKLANRRITRKTG